MPLTRKKAVALLRGIWHLPDAIAHDPNRGVVLACRVSGRSQSASLEQQEHDGRAAIREFGGELVAVQADVHCGRLSSGRRDLRNAVATARQHHAILCYHHLHRLIRPEASHGQDKPYPFPGRAEIEALLEIAGTVPLATIIRPSVPPKRVYRIITTKRAALAKAEGRRPGPARVIDDLPSVVVDRILELAASGYSRERITRLVGKKGVTVSQVRAVLDATRNT